MIHYRTNIKGEELTIADRIMPAKEVALKVGLSRPHLYKLMSEFSFPPSHKMSESKVGWLEADVLEFIKLGAVQFKSVYGEKLRLEQVQRTTAA